MLKTIRKIINWTGDRKSRLYWGFLWSFLHSMFTAMPIMGAAYILELMIKDFNGEKALDPIWALRAVMFMIAMVLGRFLFAYLRATFQESIAYEKTAEVRMRVGDILKRVSLGFFDKNNAGEILGAVTTDLSVLEMYSMKMTDVYVGGYISAFTMVLCISFFRWEIALIAIVGIIGSAVFLHILNRRSCRNAKVHQAAQNNLIASVLEYIRGISVVKAYGQEGVSADRITNAFNAHRKINVKIELDYVTANCLHQLCLKLSSVGIAVAAALMAVNNVISVSLFLMFCIFSFVIFAQVEQINNAAHTLELIEATYEKLDRIERVDFIDEASRDKKLHAFDVHFENVCFGYDRRRVLDNISFTIPQGTTTAIVGPSGSGKTTVCNLLARFYDVNKGRISIGRTDIRELKCDSLLSNISMVFQNVYLFNDSVINNIRFGKPDATEEEVIDAAKKACCHSFIAKLPQGYQTVIGEGGSSLSGGEKQRISLARAILKDAPIIILDEATASVDPENEYEIQKAISALAKGKTMLVIAHRLATIENADQIVVLDEGKIVQKGTHEQLMNKEGLYNRFVAIRQKAESWSIA
ncbi:ATP-binding cassette subfamily B protein [Anaerobacterium chartisolvens]|uniref:ATP-binding cassette subfamily B protein n=1 Tax=Anaerobacterium chartisolvens TaxID=1297424 RepID=A0A369BHB0_9FIRM|nr:ABC transporter ATP-binding protein [Anaerobacterium chartisolvens]RCX20940.1 ATP-binding cassette subfamily B protein [Anaerobacterium chartisolvens]